MNKFGLKLWSINESYSKLAPKLFDKNYFDYIELYALPNTYDDTIKFWSVLDIPFIIHAPHFMQGVNFSIREKYQENIELIKDGFKFADKLKADTIIFHPGIAGDYRESARQISTLKDSRVTIENKPYRIEYNSNLNLRPSDRCVGAKYEEIKYILDSTGIKFCLDIGHSICAANSLQLDVYDNIKQLQSLKPSMYHLSDSDINSEFDAHEHIGDGSFDFEQIFTIIDNSKQITIETKKSSITGLDDFISDSEKLYEYSRNCSELK